MDHATLIAQHEAIDAATQILLAYTRGPVPQPVDASRTLSLLSALVRDHLAVEDPIIDDTVAATRATRHGELAKTTAAELAQLRLDRTNYLYRWHEQAVAADWAGFVAESEAMLGRARERVRRETLILYSLAQHYDVIDAGA